MQSGGGLNVQVTPDDMGAGLARGMTQFGRAAVEIYKEERDRAEQIQLRDALRQAQDTHTKMLYDPNDGIMFKKGAELYSNAQKYTEDFNGSLDSIRDRLPSDRVKERFDAARGSLWNDFNKSLSIRVGQERFETSTLSMQDYTRSTMQRIATEVNAAPDNILPRDGEDSYNFEHINQLFGTTEAVVRDYIDENKGRFQRGGEDEAKRLSAEIRGKITENVLEILLSKGDTKRAKAFAKKYNLDIPYEKKAHINTAIQNGSVIDDARTQADNIINSWKPDPITGVSENASGVYHGLTPAQQEKMALEDVKKIPDAKVREQVQAFIVRDFGLSSANKQQRDTEVYEEYYDKIQKGMTLEQLATQPSYQALSAAQQENLKRAATKDPTFDAQKVYKYERAAHSNNESTRDFFRSLDLTQEPLSPKEFEAVKNLQMKLQESYLSDKGKLEYDNIRSVHEIAADAMRSAGWDEKKPKDREYIYKFQQRLDEEVKALEKKTGKKAVPADVGKVADELLKKVAVQGVGWFGDAPGKGLFSTEKKFWFELDSEEQANPETRVMIDSISETEKNVLRKEFKKKFKKDPSERELEDFYTSRMRLDRATRGLQLPTK